MDGDKAFFRGALLLLFDFKKTAAEAHRMLFDTYGEQAPSERCCRGWFYRFKSGDFDLKDKERSGQPQKFEDEELEALLVEDPHQTLQDLGESLAVNYTTVGRRLRAMGWTQEEGMWTKKESMG